MLSSDMVVAPAPCNNPGYLIGWGAQYVVPIHATRKWCLILIGGEHVTANSWLFCWDKAWPLFDNPYC